MRSLTRDPFARLNEISRQEEAVPGGCAWCGGLNARRKLFRYGIETDAGRTHWSDKLFCQIACKRGYYD